MDYLLIIFGLAGLLAGGELLVRGGVAIARRFSLPPFLIGLTIVGFGTSMPELVVSVDAAFRGAAGIAIGNVVGSNIANILLILGMSAVIWPVRSAGTILIRDLAVMMAAALVLVPLFAAGSIGRASGALLVTGLGIYLAVAFRASSSEQTETAAARVTGLAWSLVLIAFGLGALTLGARLLVDGAVGVAQVLKLPEAFIGLTIVAVGTSLPELATSLVAAFRRQSEIAIGNIVGSNIFNVLGILGVTALIAPVPVEPRFLNLDLPVMLGASAALIALLLLRPQIGRATGALMLAGYCVYVIIALA